MTMDNLKTESAANGSSSSLADEAKRIAEIQAEFQPVILEHAAWLGLEQPGACPEGLKFSMARASFVLLSRGDFPQVLGKAWAALLVFSEKLSQVLNHDSELSDSRGNPKPSFWTAFHNVVDSLNVKPPSRRVLPKLQKVMDEFNGDSRQFLWVAREFGRYDSAAGHWVGPFFTPDGSENRSAIQRELREPGSVLPAEFDPEAGRQVELIELAAVPFGLLNSLRKHIEAAEPRSREVHIDPASVEELLLQGQFPATIARVKGISEDEVRAEASRLGIRVTESTDPYGMADIHSPEDQVFRANILSPSNSPSASSLQPVPESDEPSTVSSSAPEFAAVAPASDEDRETRLNDFLHGLMQSNPDIDTPRAMQALKNAGLSTTGSDCGRRLAAMRREMSAAT